MSWSCCRIFAVDVRTWPLEFNVTWIPQYATFGVFVDHDGLAVGQSSSRLDSQSGDVDGHGRVVDLSCVVP